MPNSKAPANSTLTPEATPAKMVRPANSASTVFDEMQIYLVDPQAHIAIIRQGIPAVMVGQLSTAMGINKELLLDSLGLSHVSISHQEKDGGVLSKDDSERVLGIVSLIGKAQTMLEESGNLVGFDAVRWVAQWLTKPLPALGGATPVSYMDTFEGQKLVGDLLAMSQSGAYA